MKLLEKFDIYFAAPFFNGGHTALNRLLVKCIESRGRSVFLPQRDGYEFARLKVALAAILSTDEIAETIEIIILFFDLGYRLPRGQVVVACLDEPIDSGVSDEVAQADIMNIPVIGFRTDVRSPYGSLADPLGGAHFFPACRCRVFIRHPMPTGSDEELVSLAENILAEFHALTSGFPALRAYPPKVSELIYYANLLFEGIPDIHSTEGIDLVIKHYLEHREKLCKLLPKVKIVNG